jgi:hypothetical protein
MVHRREPGSNLRGGGYRFANSQMLTLMGEGQPRALSALPLIGARGDLRSAGLPAAPPSAGPDSQLPLWAAAPPATTRSHPPTSARPRDRGRFAGSGASSTSNSPSLPQEDNRLSRFSRWYSGTRFIPVATAEVPWTLSLSRRPGLNEGQGIRWEIRAG